MAPHAVIELSEAQARVFALAAVVDAETVPLRHALNRFVADDIRALRTQPARDLSAMDGYAIRFDDALGPWRVVGEAAAGAPCSLEIGAGDAARIFTGAALPMGTDTVVMQEHVARDGNTLTLTAPAPTICGNNTRRAGSDFIKHDVLVGRGTQLSAAQIGLLALAGHITVPVRRAIRVALLSTGDELLPLGSPADDDHIPASNAVMLTALLADLPVVVDDHGIVPDQLHALQMALAHAQNADIIVTIGGASVGDHDLVKPALLAAGADIDFWKIAMRPGKPLLAGRLGTQIVLGLPGNPVSAYVTALRFLRPVIGVLSGATSPETSPIPLRLGADLPANANRTDHVRATVTDGVATPLDSQDSAGLRALAAADGFIIRAPNAPAATKGDQVLVFFA